VSRMELESRTSSSVPGPISSAICPVWGLVAAGLGPPAKGRAGRDPADLKISTSPHHMR
jgi:hypothetical protein